MNPEKNLDAFDSGKLRLQKDLSRFCLQQQEAMVGKIFISEVVTNQRMERNFWLSKVTFNETCEDLCPFLDKTALFALT